MCTQTVHSRAPLAATAWQFGCDLAGVVQVIFHRIFCCNSTGFAQSRGKQAGNRGRATAMPPPSTAPGGGSAAFSSLPRLPSARFLLCSHVLEQLLRPLPRGPSKALLELSAASMAEAGRSSPGRDDAVLSTVLLNQRALAARAPPEVRQTRSCQRQLQERGEPCNLCTPLLL